MGRLDLKGCVTPKVGLVSRDKCARPNTIEVTVQRQASKYDRNSMNKEVKGRIVMEQ